MSTHTAGPWEHEDGEITAQGFVIAQVMGAEDFPCGEEDIDAECKANARLIAAAPELLEALEFAYLHLHDLTTKDDMEVEKKIRAAIAKVDGAKHCILFPKEPQ